MIALFCLKCKLNLQPVVSDLEVSLSLLKGVKCMEVSPSLNNYLKDVKM